MPFPYTGQPIYTIIDQEDGRTYYFLDTETLQTSRNTGFVGDKEAKEADGLVANDFKIDGPVNAGLSILIGDFYRGCTVGETRYDQTMAPDGWNSMPDEQKNEHIIFKLDAAGFNEAHIKLIQQHYSQKPVQDALGLLNTEIGKKYASSSHAASVKLGEWKVILSPFYKKGKHEMAIIFKTQQLITCVIDDDIKEIIVPANIKFSFCTRSDRTGSGGLYLHSIETDSRFVREMIMGNINPDVFTANYQYYALNHEEFKENEIFIDNILRREAGNTPLSAEKKKIWGILKELHDQGFRLNDEKTFELWIKECTFAGLQKPLTILNDNGGRNMLLRAKEIDSIPDVKKLFNHELIYSALANEENPPKDSAKQSTSLKS